MLDLVLRLCGWRALLFTGDPCVFDRWRWLRCHLGRGPLRTFDAGAGNGAFSIYAATCGNEVLGASFSEGELTAARRRAAALGLDRVEFRVIDLRELERHSATLGGFDQIICLETIEHVSDDERLVRALASLLRPGGRLLLSTPFDGHRPLYTEDPHPSPLEDGSHVRYGYSPERLAQVARDAGLEAGAGEFISGVVSQRLTSLMRRLSLRFGRPVAWLALVPLRPLVLLDAPLSALLRYPYLSVALVATKR
jgi:SAM-dependent methyltransferase